MTELLAKDKPTMCDSCLGMGNLEPETEEGDYPKCEDCNGTGIEQAENDPLEGYHGPNADDGTKINPKPKPYMSVDRNFRVTIHDGSDCEIS